MVANGSAAPPDSGDKAGEFEGASAEGTEEYVAAADASVSAEVNEQEIAGWDQQATDDVGGETAAENDESLDVETYEYEIDGETASEGETTETTSATDGEAGETETAAEGEASETETAGEAESTGEESAAAE
jgi:hypothetical protein